MDLRLNKVERDRVKAYFSWPKEFRDMLQKLEQFQLYMNGSDEPQESSTVRVTKTRLPAVKKRRKVRTWNSWSEEHKDQSGNGLGISRREHLYETFAQLRRQGVSIGAAVFDQLKKQYGVTRIAVQTQYQRWTETQRG